MIFYDFHWKIKKHLLTGGLKSQKINYLLRNDDFFNENMKTESPARHGGADCAPMPGRHWAEYIDRSAPCLPARQVRVRWLLDVRGCFLVVCQVVVFCRMLDARGNLDLESPEELLTSSSTPGPRPLRAYSFLALNFCIIFRDVFCIVFSCFFDIHFGSMLASFSMFFAWLFRASILHGFFIIFARNFMFFEVCLLISMVLHPIGERFKNTCFYISFA